MGVVGREDGVGIELTVAVVLMLAPDRRDCGRRVVLWTSGLGFAKVGEEALGRLVRYALGPEGLDTLRRSFSGFLIGEGVSSMINTHPDAFGSGVLASSFWASISALYRFGVGLLGLISRAVGRKTAVLGPEDAGAVGEADITVDRAKAFVPCRPALLPIRRRGTRV